MGLGMQLIVLDVLVCYTEESSVKWWKFDSYIEARLGGVFIVWVSIFILLWKSRRSLTGM
jgi:hypothetical protein